MIESIEKELKFLIKEDEFYSIEKYLESSGLPKYRVIQTNYYFDTKKYTLKHKGITVRLREINEQEYYFTIKMKSAESIENVHIKKEFNLEISREYFDFLKSAKDISMQEELLEPIQDIIEESLPISMRGFLTTERTAYEVVGFDEPILLDRNTYLNKVDYEIEWETEDLGSALQKIKEIFSNLGIVAEVNSISKSKRFMKLQLG